MNATLPHPNRWIHALSRLRTAVQTGLLSLALLLAGSLSLMPGEAEAKRLGGKRSVGMQREASPTPPPATPPKQADASPGAAAPATAAPAAAAGKRSWMGPLAGLAAGLGLAALLSHFGLGEGFADLMMMVLLAVAAFFVVRLILRRFAGGSPRMQPAGAGAGLGSVAMPRQASPQPDAASPYAREASQAFGSPAVAAAAPVALPADFDADGFVRLAKMIFIRMQAANDAGQVDDLRRFTTPELFAALRLDLHERGNASQQTDVVQLDAEVLEVGQDALQRVVSVRFHGLIREEAEHGAERFDEVWHLVRPLDESRDWAIAGIQQRS